MSQVKHSQENLNGKIVQLKSQLPCLELPKDKVSTDHSLCYTEWEMENEWETTAENRGFFFPF